MSNILFLVEGASDAVFLYNLFKRKYPSANLEILKRNAKHWKITDNVFGGFTILATNGAKYTFVSDFGIEKLKGIDKRYKQIFILVDQDSDDKLELENKINALLSKYNINIEAIIVACDELEAWFLADNTLDTKIKDKKAIKSSLKLGLKNGHDKYKFADKCSKNLKLNKVDNNNSSFHYFLDKCGFIFC